MTRPLPFTEAAARGRSITETEIKRAIRAGKKEGCARVTITLGNGKALIFSLSESTEPLESEGALNPL